VGSSTRPVLGILARKRTDRQISPKAALDAPAKATGRGKEPYLQEAIVEYLGDLEDFYLAEQRLADIRTGGAGRVGLADVGRDLGVAD
jgi:RHH-type rel operon transcriptional repressor/antitoxin RelB